MSLIRLGHKPPVEQSPAGLIVDCHARIRTFATLAVRLATEDAPDVEIADAAARVHRYFTEALPLHVADEEQSLAPRLRRVAPDTLEALRTMEREHRAHEALLAQLVGAWDALRTDPGRRHETRVAAMRLRDELEPHLQAEERLIIPAIGQLAVDEQLAFVAEARARRGS
jgi:iron-sulfur cluster repair protein YtfE (RIC family)